MVEVFSSGGGTQSAAIAALIAQGRLPKPDIFVIVDTGYECNSTWKYLDDVIRPVMASVGLEVHRIGPEWKSMPAHGRDYLSHNGNTLLLPAFTNISGDKGKLDGFCSNTWKVEVVNRFLSRQFGITRSKYRKWIGFSRNEWKRATKLMAGKEWQSGLTRFPLIEDVPLTRYEAIREVEKMGWPTPPRSRCYMCPNQADDEWRELKNLSPEEFKVACALEKRIQEHDPAAYLHPSCIPLEQVNLETQGNLFDPGNYCSSGVCFV